MMKMTCLIGVVLSWRACGTGGVPGGAEKGALALHAVTAGATAASATQIIGCATRLKRMLRGSSFQAGRTLGYWARGRTTLRSKKITLARFAEEPIPRC